MKGRITLLEIILSLSILMIVLCITVNCGYARNKLLERVTDKEQAIKEGQVALSYLTKDLESSDRGTVQIAENRLSFQTTGSNVFNIKPTI